MNDHKAAQIKRRGYAGPWGWILFTAYVGAAIYFWQQAGSFWGRLLSLLQAAVWPAYVLHAVLKLLNV
jgi:hypothetical protein